MLNIKKHSASFVVFIAIALLWLIRFDNLNDPYFWDEMGVYGSGVQYMVEHGISLQPKNLPPEISRGHPLLFYAIHATLLNLFGNTVVVSHLFALFISSIFLIVVFNLAKEVLPKTLAAFAALLLASQNIFLAQSSLVIPEISVALCATLGILFYLRKRFLLSAVVLSIAVLIKESAILIPAFIAIFMLFYALFLQRERKLFFSTFYYILPLVVLLAFLQIQYVQNGWYFFPYHTDIVKEDALFLFKEKLNDHAIFIFTEQHRYYFSLSLIPAFIFLLIHRNKKVAFFVFFTISSILVFSLAFYMDRYLLYIYPFYIVIALYGVHKTLAFSKPIQYLFILAISINCILSYNDREFLYDASLAYEDFLYVHQNTVDWICDLTDKPSTIEGDYFIKKSFETEHFGYVDSNCIKNLKKYSDNKPFFVFFGENVSYGEPLHIFQKEKATIYIYN